MTCLDSEIPINEWLPSHIAWWEAALDVVKATQPFQQPHHNPDPILVHDTEPQSSSSASVSANRQEPNSSQEEVDQIVDSMLVEIHESVPKFQDVPAPQSAKDAMQMSIINPTLLPHLAVKGMQSGIMLFGPPGCGKSFITMSIAATQKWTYMEAAISKLKNQWQGVSEKCVCKTS